MKRRGRRRRAATRCYVNDPAGIEGFPSFASKATFEEAGCKRRSHREKLVYARTPSFPPPVPSRSPPVPPRLLRVPLEDTIGVRPSNVRSRAGAMRSWMKRSCHAAKHRACQIKTSPQRSTRARSELNRGAMLDTFESAGERRSNLDATLEPPPSRPASLLCAFHRSLHSRTSLRS